MKVKYEYEIKKDYGWNLTECVEDKFELDNHNRRVIKMSDVRDLGFEFGGSPFTYGTILPKFNNGRLGIDKSGVEEYTEDWNGDGNVIEYLLDIGNNLNGGDLLGMLKNSKYNNEWENDEYMTEEYLKSLCLITFGEQPYHIFSRYEIEGVV